MGLSNYFKQAKQKFLALTLFGIGFGFVEATVVVYLRAILYPKGFSFPLVKAFEPLLFTTEISREFATMLMLIAVAILAGKTLLERFSYFIYSFAVWDIFYYIGLKAVLNWPLSFFTWDVLFSIPIIWVGPVLAPIVVSLTMILLSIIFIYLIGKKKLKKLIWKEWLILMSGAIIILYTFLIDYSRLIFDSGLRFNIYSIVKSSEFHQAVAEYIPTYYNWPIFLLGEAIIFVGLWVIYKRTK